MNNKLTIPENSLVITDLQPNVEYLVKVQALSESGIKSNSVKKYFTIGLIFINQNFDNLNYLFFSNFIIIDSQLQ